jgi:predicted ATPase
MTAASQIGSSTMPHRVIISGCSGGGKSTLLDELSARGHHVIPEAGREIVNEQLGQGGKALPWKDTPGFVELLLERSLANFHAAPAGLSFYDRSFIEPLCWYRATGNPLPEHLSEAAHLRYGDDVFLAPPWPEIYRQDDERRHAFSAAVEEYDGLSALFAQLGYSVHLLPKVSVAKRADFVARVLGLR